MWIIAKDADDQVNYINPAFVTRFTVEEKGVTAWGPDNLSLSLQKTKDLKNQLDALATLPQTTSPGFENFK